MALKYFPAQTTAVLLLHYIVYALTGNNIKITEG